MVERRGEPALALEARAEHRIRGERRRDELERHGPVEGQVGGAIDDPHPAPACHGVDPMAGERGADAELLRLVSHQGGRAEPGSRYVRPAATARTASTSSLSAPSLRT